NLDPLLRAGSTSDKIRSIKRYFFQLNSALASAPYRIRSRTEARVVIDVCVIQVKDCSVIQGERCGARAGADIDLPEDLRRTAFICTATSEEQVATELNTANCPGDR